jgi:hypothetical protein
MRINFLGLQAFLSVAEGRSFRSAADNLNLSQTAISHRIRKLEEELGLKLFARTHSRGGPHESGCGPHRESQNSCFGTGRIAGPDSSAGGETASAPLYCLPAGICHLSPSPGPVEIPQY